MRTRILFLKPVLVFIFILTVNKSYCQKIYFSYDSLANIIFLISDDKKEGEITIEGKKYAGVIRYTGKIKRRYYDNSFDLYDSYDFFSNGKHLLTFISRKGDLSLTIKNDNYDIPGIISIENIIDLHPINHTDNMLMYGKDSFIFGNVPLMAEKAYYLGTLGVLGESIYLFEKIISKSPDKLITYLNIADVYWENNYKEKAKEYYKKYIELMKSQGKDIDKIPSEVFERLKYGSFFTSYLIFPFIAIFLIGFVVLIGKRKAKVKTIAENRL